MPIAEIEEEPVGISNTKVVKQMRDAEDNNMLNLIKALQGEDAYNVKVYRTHPKTYEGVNILGFQDDFDELPTEAELQSQYGGGTLQLKVFKSGKDGRTEYFKTISVKISGKPKHRDLPNASEPSVIDYGPSAPAEDSQIAAQAMDMMAKLVEDGRNQKQDNGMDFTMMQTMMQTMMAPMQAQIAAAQNASAELQRAAQEKDTRIMELMAQKPDTSENDKLVHKMFDTEAHRTENLRAMHESEMRQARENSREDMKRAEDRHREELRSREKSQEREVDNMQRTHDQAVANLKLSYEARIDSLKADISRGERDLSRTDTELVTLRAKKERTPLETMSEISAMKQAFEDFGGGKDEGDQKWYEKIVGQVTENPESIGMLVQAVTGGQNPAQPPQQPQFNPPQQQVLPPQPAPQPTQQQQQVEEQLVQNVEDIPIGVPFRNAEDGEVYVRVPPDGSILPLAEAQKMAEAAAAREEIPKPNPAEVKMAISFIESAFTAGTSPENLAASVKSMIPQDITRYMEKVGVDNFLNEVAVLEAGSPLRNQAGREYIRSVAKFLLEGVSG